MVASAMMKNNADNNTGKKPMFRRFRRKFMARFLPLTSIYCMYMWGLGRIFLFVPNGRQSLLRDDLFEG
ncbi:hypothetical protein PRECH8_05200 [Insulibacter thermoxylanivorax]|uniref:Uncharacterized protein n=1 Tax=Insulibacter thermoxylanivorax TaxID=2749268 RepID=A0A916QDZ8_9BACL|nr:hypothetical protein PRECH8_05200 [Insulibacter thermoxylanivorax]